MQLPVSTPEQRLAGVIGQIIVENAKLGYEVEVLRQSLAESQSKIRELTQCVHALEAAANGPPS